MSFSEQRGLREVAIFVVGYLTYFGVRVLTQSDGAEALSNAWTLIRFEDRTGIGLEDDLQALLLPSPLLVDVFNSVYIYGHWPLLITSFVLLFHFRRGEYYLLRNALLVTGVVGLVIFALFPVAPPRLTSLPLVDTITREAGGYRHVAPPSLVNEYAAMPSYHAGWNLLLGIVLFRAVNHWFIRCFAVLSAAAMVVAVVATANHYVIDVIAGVGLALLGLLVLHLASRLRARRTMTPRDVRGRSSGGQRHPPAPARGGPRPAARRG